MPFLDYVLADYNYNIADYHLKSFSFECFVKAVLKVAPPKSEGIKFENQIENSFLSDVLIIKSGNEHIKIDKTDSDFIQSDKDYTEIFMSKK